MGVPFAERFVEFCRSRKNVEAKDVAKIESNPDQSKHLETARTTILGIELDFVNLRSEEYTESSRIPTQVVSSALLVVSNAVDLYIHAIHSLGVWYALPRCCQERYYNQHPVLQYPFEAS